MRCSERAEDQAADGDETRQTDCALKSENRILKAFITFNLCFVVVLKLIAREAEFQVFYRIILRLRLCISLMAGVADSCIPRSVVSAQWFALGALLCGPFS